jgi:hypothetical protein
MAAQAASLAAVQLAASLGASPMQQVAIIQTTISNLGTRGASPPVVAALITTAAANSSASDRPAIVAVLRQTAAQTGTPLQAVDAQLQVNNVVSIQTVSPQIAAQLSTGGGLLDNTQLGTLSQQIQNTGNVAFGAPGSNVVNPFTITSPPVRSTPAQPPQPPVARSYPI